MPTLERWRKTAVGSNANRRLEKSIPTQRAPKTARSMARWVFYGGAILRCGTLQCGAQGCTASGSWGQSHNDDADQAQAEVQEVEVVKSTLPVRRELYTTKSQEALLWAFLIEVK